MDIATLHISDEAKKILAPGPSPAKMMAAKGLVPLGPVDLISVQAALTKEEDETLRQEAIKALTGYPESILLQAAESIQDAPLLDILARHELPNPVLEALLLNKHISDKTLEWMAEHQSDARLLEVLSGNQARMVRCVGIAEGLIDNPKLPYAVRKRVEEFYLQELGGETVKADARDASATPETVPDIEPLDDLDAADAPEVKKDFSDEVTKAFIDEVDDTKKSSSPTPEEEEEQAGGLFKQLLNMKMSAKIKLALKGNKEARSILVKESNKTVSLGVLKNPGITDGEVISIAASKSVLEDHLRAISMNQQWMRNYQVKSALVHNPKTPLPVALKLVPFMRESELKQLAKSRNVSGAIAQAAKRLLAQRK